MSFKTKTIFEPGFKHDFSAIKFDGFTLESMRIRQPASTRRSMNRSFWGEATAGAAQVTQPQQFLFFF